MVLAMNIVAHVAELDIVLGGNISRRQVTDVVRLAEIVPCQELDDIGLNGVAGQLLEAVWEEGVAVSNPGIEWVAIVQILVLPWRNS